jgi:Caspase domain
MAETDAIAGLRAKLIPPARPGSRVVVVGTWSHQEGSALPAVPSVRTSVLDLASAFRDCVGVPEPSLRRVLNPDTPLELGKAITRSAAAATDSLLVYYTGHGLVGPDGGLYLATQSTEDLTEGLPYTALPYAAVQDALMRSPARTVAVILDCCFSNRPGPPRGSVPLAPVFEQATPRGGYLLAATAREERGLAAPGARHTAFTGALIRLLQEGAPALPELLTLDHTYRYLDRVLRDGGAPQPHQQTSDDVSDLVLAPNVACRRVPPPSGGPSDNGPEGSTHQCPYVGLDAFGPKEAQYFFGRERLTEDLVDRIMSSRGMIAVVGASGCGKTSVLRAGIVPELDRQGWNAAYMTPGADPAQALDKWVKALTAEERPAVLLVDQFEELFTGDVPEAERERFVTALTATAGSEISVIIAIRSDFYQACTQYPSLARVLEDHQVLVAPMAEQELRGAIEKPAKKAGLHLEEGLTRTLLIETRVRHHGEQSAVLPLLQYALLATWQHGDGSELTLAGYDAAGRVEGAVEHAGEAAWDQRGHGRRTLGHPQPRGAGAPRLGHLADWRRRRSRPDGSVYRQYGFHGHGQRSRDIDDVGHCDVPHRHRPS